MKTFFAAFFALGLLLTRVHAGELTLDGASISFAQPGAAESSTTTGTPRFGLDHGERGDASVAGVPGIREKQATDETLEAAVKDWGRTDALRTPSTGFGAVSEARPMATLTPGLPTGGALKSGGLAVWVCVGLFVGLLAALTWVGRGGLRQNAVSAEPWAPGGGVYREDRAKRVKMRPLKA